MDATELHIKQRELELKQRQLDLEEERLRNTRPQPLREWVKALGIPFAGLSILMPLLVQLNQQAHDDNRRNIEAGYQFYSAGRTALEKHSDVEKEATQLMAIGQAFPTVFCNVRRNMIERAISAKGNGSDFDNSDSDNLVALLRENAGPAAWPLPANLIDTIVDMRPRGKNERPPACLEEQPNPTRAEPIAPAPAVAAIANADSTAAAQLKTAAVSPTVLRVMFMIPRGSQRDSSSVDTAREQLAPLNYRVVRAVEKVPVIRNAEVRYYGADEKAHAPAAEQLGKYLTTKFGTPFRVRWLGATYPNVPANDVEVWLPDAQGSSAAVPSASPPQR